MCEDGFGLQLKVSALFRQTKYSLQHNQRTRQMPKEPFQQGVDTGVRKGRACERQSRM